MKSETTIKLTITRLKIEEDNIVVDDTNSVILKAKREALEWVLE